LTKIRDVEVFLTAPDGQDLVVVRVQTDQPGLYGLGCATLAYRASAVREVLLTYLKPLLIGRDASRIEDLWALMHHNPY
jgi:mannonate dehydratase